MTFTLRGEVGGGVLKMGIIINKRYFVFFLDWLSFGKGGGSFEIGRPT